ncbi:MAG: ATPase, T2SS/T4P/T4SS family [Thermoproteota archaeon]|nr:ATPase, T2SS/T4P/T4SS family [Thermoproteota archaeon]
MIKGCNSCKVLIKNNTINFICPYEEFGLEEKEGCRARLYEIIKQINKDFNYNIIFTNLKTMKIYNENIFKKILNNFYYFNNKIRKFILMKKYRIEKNFYDYFFYNPIKILEIYPDLKEKMIKKIITKTRLNLFEEICLLHEMEYGEKEIYNRIFEPDVTLNDTLIMTYKLKEIVSRTGYTINIFENQNSEIIYYVNITDRKRFPETKFNLLSKMSLYSNNLLRLIVAILDENVQEIYLDKENDWVYLDHEKYGRCFTNIFLSSTDVEKFKTFLSLVTGEEITPSNPSVKVSLQDTNVKLRIAIDTYPITESTAIDIRKFKKNMLTLQDLIRIGSVEKEIAAFLIYCLKKRAVIVICGEPNSGKTTFAHAISRYLQENWRKIYLEDIDELYSSNDSKFKLFIKTRSIDVSNKYSQKKVEIIKMLHRSPDWIFLGEIQTKEHTLAMFQAIHAGLKGLMTCHSSSPHELIKRWILQYKIHPSSITSLNFIVGMKKEIKDKKIIRYLNEVYEVSGLNEEGSWPKLKLIYKKGKYNLLHNTEALKDIIFINRIINEERTTFENILSEIRNLQEVISNV